MIGWQNLWRRIDRKERRRPPTARSTLRLEWLEDRCVPTTNISEFALPSGLSAYAIVAGPDGAMWFSGFTSNEIGRITTTGAVTRFALPNKQGGPQEITVGPDGNLWYTSAVVSNLIGRITTAGAIAEFTIPTGFSRPEGITSGPDGNLWFAEYIGNKIGRITPAGVITEFSLPEPNSNPTSIVTGQDGSLWFTETIGNRIGRIATNGAITEYPVPTAGSSPLNIAAGADGNLWFTEQSVSQIGRITPAGAIKEFVVPTASSGPRGIAQGPDGNIWFAEWNANKIGQITTSGFVAAEFTVPTTGSRPWYITTGPHGTMWFTDTLTSKIGVIHNVLDTKHEYVEAIFEAALARQATSKDLDYWVNVLDKNGSASVANSIQRSTEARTVLVKDWYQTYLGRAADSGGLNYMLKLMVVNKYTEEQALAQLLASPEYYDHAADLVGAQRPLDASLVRALFLQLLGRFASDSDLTYWKSQLTAVGRAAMVQALQGTAEYRTIMIQAAYSTYLHRGPASSSEVNYWLGQNLDETSLCVAFELTQEFALVN